MHARWKITGDRNKRDRQPRGVPVPGTARNRGSLRSNRAKLRASSPCRLDRRADLRNEEGQIVIPREKNFRAEQLAPQQPAETGNAATRTEAHTSELQTIMRTSYDAY